jgi:hypothetical protein
MVKFKFRPKNTNSIEINIISKFFLLHNIPNKPIIVTTKFKTITKFTNSNNI